MKLKLFVLSVAAFAVIPSLSVRAEDLDTQKYLTLKSLTIQEVTDTGTQTLGVVDLGPASDIDEAEIILDKIINMGKKIWAIVEANKPVVNVTTDTANAVPEGTKGWQSLQGWQAPKSKLFRITYENLYGMDVVDFQFRVLYTFGGNVNGKGRYLTNVTMVPANLDVSWGYTFNATGNVPSVTNAGTSAEPVAAMELLMKWSVDTVLKHSESTASFYVRGDGQFLNLSNGN